MKSKFQRFIYFPKTFVVFGHIIEDFFIWTFRSQRLRGLRRGPTAARWLGLRVRIPPDGMDVCCDICVFCQVKFSAMGRSHVQGESYRICCVWLWSWSLDSEASLAHWGAVEPWRKTWGYAWWSWKNLPFEIHLERKKKSEDLIVLGYCLYRFVYWLLLDCWTVQNQAVRSFRA